MSDGMGRELAYLSSHATNRYFIPNWGKLLTSDEGLKQRGRRCIEPEAVFGQIKFDMAYRRFRHFGKDKVEMDFAFFAIAFNLKKMIAKMNLGGLKHNLDHISLISYLIERFCDHFQVFGSQKRKLAA